jgi:hypothetical protein
LLFGAQPRSVRQTAKVIVVEDGDPPEIVGTWAVYPQVHAEGIWVAPKHRKHSMVPRYLFKQLGIALTDLQAQGFLTAAISDDVANMLLKNLGATELPGRHFVVPAPSLGGA